MVGRMEILNRNRLFQKLATGVLITFFGIMFLVVGIAYSRTSGKTGMDMGRAQQLRYQTAATHNLTQAPEMKLDKEGKQ